MKHRVFTHYRGPLWVGVGWMAQRQQLTREMEYVTLQVVSGGEVCLTMPDGRILCDFGPGHDHEGDAQGEAERDLAWEQARRLTDG